MLIIPTIYLKGGAAIHPTGGNISTQDPDQLISEWIQLGTKLIHIVDYDAPLTGSSPHEPLIRRTIESHKVNVHIEATFKSTDTIARYISIGCRQIVLGTIAYQKHDFVESACKKYPNKITTQINVKDNAVVIPGMPTAAHKTAIDFANRFKEMGVSDVLYSETDVDGNVSIDCLNRMRDFLDAVKIHTYCSSDPSELRQIEGLLRLEKFGLLGIVLAESMYKERSDLRTILHFTSECEMRTGDEETLIPD
jgi:phosphoribosylformimino-5-aminoimidazole carboxamide ribotide isomerase